MILFVLTQKSKSKGVDASKLMHLETFEDDEIAKARKLVGKELQNGTYLPDLISPVFI